MLRSTHSSKLERWLGVAAVEDLSRSMRGWYGPPIAVANVPGTVWATGDGDFIGPIGGGRFASALDVLSGRARRWWKRQRSTLNAGFASLDDFLSEAKVKTQTLNFSHLRNNANASTLSSDWCNGPYPPAIGGNASPAPGGRACTSTTRAGGWVLKSYGSGDTRHVVGATFRVEPAAAGNVGNPGNLLLYDRLFDVLRSSASSSAETITGVPTRYQSSSPLDADYAGGNFVYPEATDAGWNGTSAAHNWTGKYTNQAGATNVVLPSVAGLAGQLFNASVDMYSPAQPLWFAPLAAGDTGVMALSETQCSSASVTGNLNFVIGHPLAWFPCIAVRVSNNFEFVNSATSLVRVFDNACLGFMRISENITSSYTYSGSITLVSG
jgi:hypothetical protein